MTPIVLQQAERVSNSGVDKSEVPEKMGKCAKLDFGEWIKLDHFFPFKLDPLKNCL